MIHIENLKYKYQGAKQYVFDGFATVSVVYF